MDILSDLFLKATTQTRNPIPETRNSCLLLLFINNSAVSKVLYGNFWLAQQLDF